jgi:1,4-dihydroxy-6-naphthoate synthase
MWWPLFEVDGDPAPVQSDRFRFEAVTHDIETLNERSRTGELEITAISCAQYPWVKDRYALTACGSSMGDEYGPKLVSRVPMSIDALKRPAKGPPVMVAVPGVRTSAFAALNIMLGAGTFGFRAVPFDQIIERVCSGEFDAGLVIHEGQLTFAHAGLHLVEDLGRWWSAKFHLPMPLGANVIRRDLEQRFESGTLREVMELLLRSVEYSMAHRAEGLSHARAHGRGITEAMTDQFVDMYVNKWTLDFGAVGRKAVEEFLGQASAAGLVPATGEIDFVQPLEESRAFQGADQEAP